MPSEEEEKIVTQGPFAGRVEGEPDKTLQEARFVIGDFIDCAIFPPLADGAVAPPPSRNTGMGRGGYNGGPPSGRGGYGESRGVNGFGGGYRGRGDGGTRGGGMHGNGRLGGEGLPSGEWRRGERVPEGPGRGGYGRGRGRG